MSAPTNTIRLDASGSTIHASVTIHRSVDPNWPRFAVSAVGHKTMWFRSTMEAREWAREIVGNGKIDDRTA